MTPGEKLAQLMHSGRLVCSADDVAAIMNMTRWSVYDAVKSGQFPIEAIKVGRRIRFRVADIARLVGAEW